VNESPLYADDELANQIVELIESHYAGVVASFIGVFVIDDGAEEGSGTMMICMPEQRMRDSRSLIDYGEIVTRYEMVSFIDKSVRGD
jgi:hypothetical protein